MTAPVQHPMYIDGQFEAGRGDAWIEVINPATEALISRIPDGSRAGKPYLRSSERGGCVKSLPVSANGPTRSPR